MLLPRRARGPRGPRLHDAQVPHAGPGRREPARRLPRARARRAHARRGHEARPLAAGDAARRAPAVLERPPRRHEPRRPASDPPALLRGARRRPAGVLAAPRRPARSHRASRRSGAATRRRWRRSSRTTSSGSPTARCASTCARCWSTGWRVVRQSLRGVVHPPRGRAGRPRARCRGGRGSSRVRDLALAPQLDDGVLLGASSSRRSRWKDASAPRWPSSPSRGARRTGRSGTGRGHASLRRVSRTHPSARTPRAARAPPRRALARPRVLLALEPVVLEAERADPRKRQALTTSVKRITQNVRKMISSRAGNGAPASVSSGIASAAASETAPRMPGPAEHDGTATAGTGRARGSAERNRGSSANGNTRRCVMSTTSRRPRSRLADQLDLDQAASPSRTAAAAGRRA